MPDRPLTPPNPPPRRRSPFEWSLAGLRPADADIARPSFMYKAGQASRDRQVRFWQFVSAVLGVVIVVGGIAAYGAVAAERERVSALLAIAHSVQQPPTFRPADDPNSDSSSDEVMVAVEKSRLILVGGLGVVGGGCPPGSSGPPTLTLEPGLLAAPSIPAPRSQTSANR